MIISSFTGEYRFLSNFSPAEVILDGEKYHTVEHAYQAAKTLKAQERKTIQALASPGSAKRMGKTVTISNDWERRKLAVMRFLLDQKFYPDRPEANLLLRTHPHILIEGNTWGDKFWGATWDGEKFDGSNYLGVMLMQIRQGLSIILQ